jgi:hypothetical protein
VTVRRDGGLVLFVVSHVPFLKRAEIGANFTASGWWYVWVADSRTIGPVDDTVRVAEIIVRHLRRPVAM